MVNKIIIIAAVIVLATFVALQASIVSYKFDTRYAINFFSHYPGPGVLYEYNHGDGTYSPCCPTAYNLNNIAPNQILYIYRNGELWKEYIPSQCPYSSYYQSNFCGFGMPAGTETVEFTTELKQEPTPEPIPEPIPEPVPEPIPEPTPEPFEPSPPVDDSRHGTIAADPVTGFFGAIGGFFSQFFAFWGGLLGL